LSFNKIQGKQIGIKPSIYIFKVWLRFVSKLELIESATVILVSTAYSTLLLFLFIIVGKSLI
jgi:hypothetical protein